MSEPRHRTDVTPAARRAGSVGRAWLTLLVVAAAVLVPVATTTAADRVGADRVEQSTGTHPGDPAHLAPAARTVRVAGDAQHRTTTPVGTIPGGAVLTVVLLLLLAQASQARPSTPRRHPSFLRRGPPLLPFTV